METKAVLKLSYKRGTAAIPAFAEVPYLSPFTFHLSRLVRLSLEGLVIRILEQLLHVVAQRKIQIKSFRWDR
jgi:hypothetical protein